MRLLPTITDEKGLFRSVIFSVLTALLMLLFSVSKEIMVSSRSQLCAGYFLLFVVLNDTSLPSVPTTSSKIQCCDSVKA
jgi:hypothetical protein